MVKKMLFLLTSVALVLTGCSDNQSLSSNKSLSANNQEATATSDDIIVEAIKNRDFELMKSLFSNEAKSLSVNIDNDINDMFELYKGDFIKYTQKNYSSEYTPGENESMYLNPVRVFQTTEGYYKLSWNEFTKYKRNTDMIGIYSMKLEEWPDEGLNEGGQVLPVAGIVTPDNNYINEITVSLLKVICQRDYVNSYKEDFKNLFSEKIQIIDGMADDFLEKSYDFKIMRNNKGWKVFDSHNNEYICLLNAKNQRYMIFRIDKTNADKIAYLKIGLIENDCPVEKYIPQQEEIGIYI